MREDGKETADEKLHWERNTSPGWQVAVNAWPWQSIGSEGWEKSGSCPRCKDGVTISTGDAVVETVEIASSELEDALERAERGPLNVQVEGESLFYARCDCGGDHPGRPPELNSGCGSWGLIEPPPPNG